MDILEEVYRDGGKNTGKLGICLEQDLRALRTENEDEFIANPYAKNRVNQKTAR
jgi:hypothetical protein